MVKTLQSYLPGVVVHLAKHVKDVEDVEEHVEDEEAAHRKCREYRFSLNRVSNRLRYLRLAIEDEAAATANLLAMNDEANVASRAAASAAEAFAPITYSMSDEATTAFHKKKAAMCAKTAADDRAHQAAEELTEISAYVAQCREALAAAISEKEKLAAVAGPQCNHAHMNDD
jgi:hypothetical protein